MAQDVMGFAKTTGGGIPLGGPDNTALADGSNSTELLSNSTFTVTAQSLGTIAMGQTVTHLAVWAMTGIAYCGILRNGQYIGVCQALGSDAYGGMPKYAPILPSPVQLVAGDQVIVRVQA